MNRSTTALVLTTFSAIIAHISIYLPNLTVKYIISGLGAILAIFGAILLFSIRKPFVKIYHRSDWYIKNHGSDKAQSLLHISFKEFKKSTPHIQVDYYKNGYWASFDPIIAVDEDSKEVTLAVRHFDGAEKYNFDNLDKVRVTIK